METCTETPWIRAVDLIMGEVVRSGRCFSCEACIVACPTSVFDFIQNHPDASRDYSCFDCDICRKVCPVVEEPLESILIRFPVAPNAIDEGFGPYKDAFIARSSSPDILRRAQDGGVATTLLVYGLRNDIIDAVAMGGTDKENRHLPRALLARTEEEVLEGCGSRYTYSPNLMALQEWLAHVSGRIAVVGVPCQITGLRHIQSGEFEFPPSAIYRDQVAFTIGLFCSKAFLYEGMVALADALAVKLEDIEKVNIKGKVVVRLKDGRELSYPLSRFRKYSKPECARCHDYSAEYADISLGGIGVDGWTVVVVRTEKGQEIVSGAVKAEMLEVQPLESASQAKELLIKHSKLKRSSGQGSILSNYG